MALQRTTSIRALNILYWGTLVEYKIFQNSHIAWDDVFGKSREYFIPIIIQKERQICSVYNSQGRRLKIKVIWKTNGKFNIENKAYV